MSSSISSSQAGTMKLLKELNETIKENNKVTSEQNEKMVNYTRWLFILTIAIGVIAAIQLTTVLVLSF